jgi:hypothetical protein
MIYFNVILLGKKKLFGNIIKETLIDKNSAELVKRRYEHNTQL